MDTLVGVRSRMSAFISLLTLLIIWARVVYVVCLYPGTAQAAYGNKAKLDRFGALPLLKLPNKQ